VTSGYRLGASGLTSVITNQGGVALNLALVILKPEASNLKPILELL